MSQTARRDRPIRRWISWVRPDWRPRAASLGVRSTVEPGSIEYSAVTHPQPTATGFLPGRAGLTSAHVLGSPLVVPQVRGLAQGEVEAGAERLERPRRPGVGRVSDRGALPVDADGQGLRTVVGSPEG